MKMHDKPGASKAQVAVVEPDEAVRDSLAFALAVDGYTVRSFRDLSEFLGSCLSTQCDCLVFADDAPDRPLVERWFREDARRVGVRMVAKPAARICSKRLRQIVKPLEGTSATEAVADALRTRDATEQSQAVP